MIEHTQTIMGSANPDAVPGNCMQTAVAALLDLPVEKVPHFILFGNDYDAALVMWLRSRGKRLRVYVDDEHHRFAWARAGINARLLNGAPNGQMMIAVGHSPNGPWGHTVLWKAGALVWDVHPARAGIVGEPYEFWQVTDACAI
ncbi:hypothetical protein [Subtercola sp. YIM 133946]|uniref:hypothetical protein n=1 Tax=Subtercola sp. YIM 133946 TaxID=3118909 RepID=UPI002F9511E6